MTMKQVLTLDIAGRPYAWLNPEEAVTYYAKNKVAWELGRARAVFRGGYNHHGARSRIEVAPIIAIAGSEIMASMAWDQLVLSDRDNTLLFKRDQNTCGYCGRRLARRYLTRDHILARSRGGKDTWTNCVTACRDCNQAKGARMVEDFRPLIYVPYAPCRFEHFLLSGRNVLADQHAYLRAKLPKHSRLRAH
ncbi:HNH endonuclease [Chitinimonas sp. JJ19]|uniref:HNH endonuclease n=1 Tax=Chitinimonas sp. JJ19 TaxID=3109352 RepID=UPI0030038776